jgi:hypothetical protein
VLLVEQAVARQSEHQRFEHFFADSSTIPQKSEMNETWTHILS